MNRFRVLDWSALEALRVLRRFGPSFGRVHIGGQWAESTAHDAHADSPDRQLHIDSSAIDVEAFVKGDPNTLDALAWDVHLAAKEAAVVHFCVTGGRGLMNVDPTRLDAA